MIRTFPAAAVLVVVLGMAAACGSAEPDETAGVAGVVGVPDRATASESTMPAGTAITAFGLDLFGEVRAAAPTDNLTVSPASVAIALAMLEPGTVNDAQSQMRAVLHIEDAPTFHSSMNALEQSLEGRVAEAFGSDDDPGEITVRVANAAYLQKGYPFETAYLDAVGSNYGPVLLEVDFLPDPDAVAHEINAFVADATNDRIVDLVGDGVIKPDTVLALVNALYLKASWLETFEADSTADTPFTLLDGSQIPVPMMNGGSSFSAAGDGWIAASKSYVGQLSAQFILPDEGRFEEIAATLSDVLPAIGQNRTSGSILAVPRFDVRSSAELTEALMALGLTAPYVEGGLLGMAPDPLLIVDKVIHEAFVAMDEDGTEAAAATVVLVRATGGPILPPVPVVLDRPFIFRIVDDVSGATLFIGQITNPAP